MKIEILPLALISLVTLAPFAEGRAEPANPSFTWAASRLSDQDIADAYLYLLGRILVLRQQRIDLEQGYCQWNKLTYRELTEETNPNLDVACAETWVAVDEQNCVVLDIPAVKGRYFTWHMINGWGETVVNINERTYPRHVSGKFALCLAESHPKIPEGAQRVDLPCRSARVFARVEIAANEHEAWKLLRKFKLMPQGEIEPETPIRVPLFSNNELPGVEAFDFAEDILAGEPDVNPGMEVPRAKVRCVEALAKADADGRIRVGRAIQKLAVPALMLRMQHWDVRNGWLHASPAGNYGNDYVMRTLTNLTNFSTNSSSEMTSFTNQAIDGSGTFLLTFPAEAIPRDKAHCFWSIIALDATDARVLPNIGQRYLLNSQSPLRLNPDGSLTLAFAPEPPLGVAELNWLPTIPGEKYNLILRLYGPSIDVVCGQYSPPALVEQK